MSQKRILSVNIWPFRAKWTESVSKASLEPANQAQPLEDKCSQLVLPLFIQYAHCSGCC